MPTTRSSQTPPAKLTTLAIDVGGTGIKASVLDQAGHMERDRVREDTPYPLSPEGLLGVIESLVAQLPTFDRVSLGFPGMVREGRILSAPHFVSPTGPEGDPSPKLVNAWIGCDLQGALSARLGKPTKVANDADQQGAAVVTGEGLELVMTLGTGVGSALFYHGRLCPHLELAHHPFNAKGTYNEVLGDATRKQVGGKKWNKRVVEMVDVLRALIFFDHLYIGGGNSMRIASDLGADVSIVSNQAGILGGIKLWDRTEPTPTPAPAVTARKDPTTRKVPAAPA
ncbi:MAG TPA: ROK family protein [Acidimicrobiales bacterium]